MSSGDVDRWEGVGVIDRDEVIEDVEEKGEGDDVGEGVYLDDREDWEESEDELFLESSGAEDNRDNDDFGEDIFESDDFGEATGGNDVDFREIEGAENIRETEDFGEYIFETEDFGEAFGE